MVILHVAAPGGFGGLEQVVQALASGHWRRGHRVHVAAVLDAGRGEPPFLDRLRSSGVSVVTLPLPPRAYWREQKAISELCREVRPDVVHTHGYRADVVDSPAARRLGIATVTTVHGFTGGGWKNRLYERLQSWAFRRFDAVVAVSHPLARQLAGAGICSDRLHVVPNAWSGGTPVLGRVAARRTLGLPQDGFRIGWIGRLTREKGADVLLDAVAQLRDLPVAVSVLGDGRERQALGGRARRLEVEDRVRWHGAVPDAASLFCAFDVFLLSSRTEGTPIVLFEAMAARVPIVAAEVGGVPDVVTRSEALLVPPEDAAALADAVRAVWRDPDAARVRAEAAHRRLVQQFAVSPWLARYEAIYQALGVPAEGGP